MAVFSKKTQVLVKVFKHYFSEAELRFQVSRSGGPGGQNVNRTNSAVTLWWSLAEASWLTLEQVELLRQRLGSRLTQSGEIQIRADEYRDQERNRSAAIDRLVDLLNLSLHAEAPRKRTKPTYSSKVKRVESKRQRSEIKKTRRSRTWSED